MTLLLASPTVSRLTGGYRFNDEVATRLSRRGSLHYEEVPSAELAARLKRLGTEHLAGDLDSAGTGRNIAAVLLDSIYFSEPDSILPVIEQIDLPCGLLCHQIPPALESSGREAAQHLLSTLDFFIVPSRFMAQVLTTRGVNEKRIHRCEPGIANRSAPSETTRRGDRVPLRLLSVSNDTENKNLPWLAARLAELSEISWEWHVAGSPTGALTATHLSELGIRSRSWLHGALEPAAVRELMAQSDVLLHPSRFESYGMVIAEALSHGLPVVANDTGAVGELVADGENGFLLPVDDRRAWYAAISRLVTEPALRTSLGRGAMQRAQKLPSWEDTAEAVERALAQESTEQRRGAAR